MSTCPTSEVVKYEVSFYFENKKNPGVDPIMLVKYSLNVPFPEFKKGEKFYIGQSDIHPRTEDSIREKLKIYSEDFVTGFINEYKSFSKEHWIHKVKIKSVHKGLQNEWLVDGNSCLVYNIEYKLKECFYWSWSYSYWKRVITEKFEKIKTNIIRNSTN
jgi:hypothetical protein